MAGADAQLTVDGANLASASNTVANLIPGVTFQLLAPSAKESDGSLEQIQVVIGNDNTDVSSAINQFVNDYNSLISAMNTQEGNDSSGHAEPLYGSPTLSLLQQQLLGALNTQNPNGSLDTIATNTNTTLAGSINIKVGSGTTQTITLDSSDNTLEGLAGAINAAKIGVTAGVVTTGTRASLTLLSQTAGSSGALTVSSSIVATSDTLLKYTGSAGTITQNSSGALTTIPNAADVLSGSISVRVGSGVAASVSMADVNTAEGGTTLADLESYINANSSTLGVTASVVTNNDGSSSLSLLSDTAGSAGTLTVTSSILDTTNTSSTTLNYNNSSDVSTLANMGISVSTKDDGSLTFDATSLTSVLNSDYSGVVGLLPERQQLGPDVFKPADPGGNEFFNGHSVAGLSIQQQHRVLAQRGHLQRGERDLHPAEEPDRRVEQRQRDSAGVALGVEPGRPALLGDHWL